MYPQTTELSGFTVPTWLPLRYAADQAAVIIFGLVPYYKVNGDSTVLRLIRLMTEGIQLMQTGEANQFPFFCFLSWQNQWHAYGNGQADALLQAASILNDATIYNSAQKEVDFFYPYIAKRDYLNKFTLSKENNSITVEGIEKYEQIAYGIRPMVFACLQAYKYSSEDKYANLAGELSSWLFGKNSTNLPLYDSNSGICFDGINNEGEINKNSGAESTIEALLTILEVEQNEIAKSILYNYIDSRKEN